MNIGNKKKKPGISRSNTKMSAKQVLEAIRQAQQSLNTLNMVYVKLDGTKAQRHVECYETKIEKWSTFLYAFDLTNEKEHHIKKFLVDRIEYAAPSSNKFTPRWPIKL